MSLAVNETQGERSPGTEGEVAVRAGRRPLLKQLWFWVFVAIAAGIVLGAVDPNLGIAMQPLGTGFIKLITMFIGPLIFCTIVSGMARMADVNRLGALAIKAIVVFEGMTAIGMIIAFLFVDVLRPGEGFHISGLDHDSSSLSQFVVRSHGMQLVPFLLDIIPASFAGAFSSGNVLQVVFVSMLCGVVIVMMKEHAAPFTRVLDTFLEIIFRVIRLVMWTAPIGAFGAIAFGIGKYGLHSIVTLGRFIGEFYVMDFVFFCAVSLPTAAWCGFSLLKFVRFFRDEILVCIATTSSEVVLPRLIDKLEQLGCDRSIAGVILPTGFSFNPTGTGPYLVMVICFLAQAIGKPLDLGQQVELFLLLNVISRSAVGIAGTAFVVLVGTVQVWGPVPVAATGIILGIHRLLAQSFVPTFAFTNAMSALAVAKWENAIDHDKLDAMIGRSAVREKRPTR